jgi:hypothetical protein
MAQYWSAPLPAIVLLTSSSIFAQSKANAKNASRPNILVILADDLPDWHPRENQNRIDDSKLAGLKQRLRERLEQWNEKHK